LRLKPQWGSLEGRIDRIFEKRKKHAPWRLRKRGDVFFCNREGKIREEVRIERVRV
jgi:hypothetical protein